MEASNSTGPTPVQEQLPAQPPVQAPSGSAPSPSATSSSPSSLPDHLKYKNRLQEFTQRSGIPLPVYQTIDEGFPHVAKFRSSVLVDGACYTSPNLFPGRKAAEQDVARLAMISITERTKDVAERMKDAVLPPIHEDMVFCKAILHEYAMKRGMDKPTYGTVPTEGLITLFVSSLNFNGVSYTGEARKSKKEAEQLAARVAIQSLLGDSESGSTMLEIIKSKYRLYAALHKVKDPNNVHASPITPAVNTGHISSNAPIPAVPEASVGMLPPHHDFVKINPQEPAPQAPQATPQIHIINPQEPAPQATPQIHIIYVPSGYEHPPSVFPTSLGVTPTSSSVTPTSSSVTPTSSSVSPASLSVSPTFLGVSPNLLGANPTYLGVNPASKKRGKSKKKAKKKSPNDAQLPVTTSPMNLNLPALQAIQ